MRIIIASTTNNIDKGKEQDSFKAKIVKTVTTVNGTLYENEIVNVELMPYKT